jgi:hypothetical protein
MHPGMSRDAAMLLKSHRNSPESLPCQSAECRLEQMPWLNNPNNPIPTVDPADIMALWQQSKDLEAQPREPGSMLMIYHTVKKIDPDPRKALRAHEIPDLLSESFLFKVSAADRLIYRQLRTLRRNIAHGSAPPLSVHSAIKKVTELRTWAARTDEHVGEHFLVLAKYAP